MTEHQEYGFLLKPALCIQCHSCESACRNWRGIEAGISLRKVRTIEQGSFPNTKVTYLTMSCMHCAEPACLDVCPVGAISKDEDGIVRVEREACIGCEACGDACPFGIPQFGKDGTMQMCDMCAGLEPEEMRSPCVRMCPTHALKRVRMSTVEKQEQEEKLKREFF